jgi:hypothetical protein
MASVGNCKGDVAQSIVAHVNARQMSLIRQSIVQNTTNVTPTQCCYPSVPFMESADALLPSRVILSGAGSREANGEFEPRILHQRRVCASNKLWKQVPVGRLHQSPPFLAAQ